MGATTFSRRSLGLGALVAGVVASGQSFADERYDHRGAVGLLVGATGEYRQTLSPTVLERPPGVELGGSWAVGVDGNDLVLMGRASFLRSSIDYGATLGYRGYFGHDRFKTFYDAGWALHVTPRLVTGPRLGFGLQYELFPVMGVYLGFAAKGLVGSVVRLSAEAITGIQLRSYWLE